MKKYEILCTETCEDCRGHGVVTNPNWVKFFEETKDKPEITEAQWAEANGFESVKSMGFEEVPCVECEGAGKMVYPVLLQEVLKELGVFDNSDK